MGPFAPRLIQQTRARLPCSCQGLLGLIATAVLRRSRMTALPNAACDPCVWMFRASPRNHLDYVYLDATDVTVWLKTIMATCLVFTGASVSQLTIFHYALDVQNMCLDKCMHGLCKLGCPFVAQITGVISGERFQVMLESMLFWNSIVKNENSLRGQAQ